MPTYSYSDGNITLSGTGALDTLDFDDNTGTFDHRNFSFLRSGNDLLIYADNGGTITITDHFANNTNRIETLSFNGGNYELDLGGSVNAVTTASATLTGTSGDDVLLGGASENNTIDGDSGNDIIYGGNGNDTILGGDGNDALYADSDSDTLKGEDGNDYLFSGNGSSGISTLDGGNGSDTLEAGTKNSSSFGHTFKGGTDSDIYKFNTDSDYINIDESGDKLDMDTICFGTGINFSDLTISYQTSPNKVVIYGTSLDSTITILGQSSSVIKVERLAFADGSFTI